MKSVVTHGYLSDITTGQADRVRYLAMHLNGEAVQVIGAIEDQAGDAVRDIVHT